MAMYRTISLTFWTDKKITDRFTAKERYFYLYLLTNHHTSLSGTYEISKKQMANELGFSLPEVEELIKSLEKKHNVICYSDETEEILLVNHHKHSWTESEKFKKAVEKELVRVKNFDFKMYLNGILNKKYRDDSKLEKYFKDTSCMNTYCIDTNSIKANCCNTPDTVTVSDTDAVAGSDIFKEHCNNSTTNTCSEISIEELKQLNPSLDEDRIKGLNSTFNEIWSNYPQKEKPEEARAVFFKINPSSEQIMEILSAINGYKQEPSINIPLLSEWLTTKYGINTL